MQFGTDVTLPTHSLLYGRSNVKNKLIIWKQAKTNCVCLNMLCIKFDI